MADVVDTLDRLVVFMLDIVGRIIFGASPGGLAKVEIVVVADLKIEGAGLFEVGGIWLS